MYNMCSMPGLIVPDVQSLKSIILTKTKIILHDIRF